jgi:signal transduction histidine kinase
MLPSCGDKCAELTELTDKIKEEVRRANYMVLNFMNYGRPLKLRRALVPYGEILSKVLPLLNDRLTEQHIQIVQEIDNDLPPLWVDQELLRNCILNFINNAVQAMDNGGSIRLGANLDEIGSRIRLTFSDQGKGIQEEDIAKIFQPYFTTKDVGIGLGLAITERIIKEHGGEILTESSPGQGTTFTVVLPLRQEQQEASPCQT